MPRVNIDEKALTDPRVLMLARKTSLDVFAVVGRLAFLWHHCIKTETAILPSDHVDAITNHDGFGSAMEKAGLAELTADGLYIRGATERIKNYKTNLDNAKAGGVKSAETR